MKQFRDNYVLFLLSFLSCLSEILFPVWFYQGVEKMKYITLIRFTSIFFYTVTVFIFIKNESDYLLIPLLQSLGWLLSGVISFFMLIRVEKISLFVPTIESIRRYFKESVPFFVSRVSVVINASMAKLDSTFVKGQVPSLQFFGPNQKLQLHALKRKFHKSSLPYLH